MHEDQATSGKIIWVSGVRPEADPPSHLCYVVENDETADVSIGSCKARTFRD